MLGLTRENLSHNALGIGLGIGCVLGGMVAPMLLPPEIGALTAHDATATAPEFVSTAAAAINGTAAASFHARGYLGAYLSTLRHLSSVSSFDQWWALIVTAMVLLIAKLAFQLFARPFEYVRGYQPDKRLEAAYLRLAGAIPPGYPNTWYKVCDEQDVPSSYSGGCFRIDALGETLLIFRAPAVHPFGSTVKEGEVVVLVESSLNGVDPMRDLAACGLAQNPLAQRWMSQEINRMVFVWYHDANFQTVEGEPSPDPARPSSPTLSLVQPPTWPIPLIKGMENWNYHGRVTHEIACHIQEIPENGADVAHLEYIHGDFLLSWLGKLVRHEWSASWDPQHEPMGHVAKLLLTQKVTVCGVSVPGTSLDSNIDQCGPALVQLIFPTPFGKVAVIECITPIVHTLQRAQNVLYAEKTVPRFLAKVFLMGLVVQFERDLPIWNYKQFLRKPLILKEDGPILRYRRWMRQFYSNPEYQKELQTNSEALMRFANE